MTDMKKAATDMKKAALELAEAGIPVFPCKNNTHGDKAKQPLTRHGFKDASTDPTTIEKWWTKHPDAWIGRRTGDLSELNGQNGQNGQKLVEVDVIDVDVKTGNGKEELKKLKKEYGELPDTYVVKTPTGGLHIYVKHIEGLSCSSGKLADSIDIRATDGYVIVPPSDGYVIVPPSDGYGVAEDKSVKSPGEKWEKKLKSLKNDVSDSENQRGSQGLVPEGQRHDYLAQRAGEMLGRGMQPEVVFAALCAEREFCCAPGEHPISDTEIHNLAFKTGWQEENSFTPQPEPGQFEIKSITAAELKKKRFKPIAWRVEGILPAGTSNLVAPPKEGKTRFVECLAVSVATGERFLGKFPTKQCDVLFLNLDEASHRMTKERRKDMELPAPDNLYYVFENVPTLDEGFGFYIDQWMNDHPETGLIIIDMLKNIKPIKGKTNGQNEYDYESLVQQKLQDISRRYEKHSSLSILTLHHARKMKSLDNWMEDSLGSTATPGGVDTVFSILRNREGNGMSFVGKGREIPEFSHGMKLDEKGVWQLVAEGISSIVSDELVKLWEILGKDKMRACDIAMALRGGEDFSDDKEKNREVRSVHRKMEKYQREIQSKKIKGALYYYC